jgi:hypothetical protein
LSRRHEVHFLKYMREIEELFSSTVWAMFLQICFKLCIAKSGPLVNFGIQGYQKFKMTTLGTMSKAFVPIAYDPAAGGIDRVSSFGQPLPIFPLCSVQSNSPHQSRNEYWWTSSIVGRDTEIYCMICFRGQLLL